jgi:hypothetical protein
MSSSSAAGTSRSAARRRPTVDGSHDPDGDLGRAPGLDEVDQAVQVEPAVAGEHDRRALVETGRLEPPLAPAGHVDLGRDAGVRNDLHVLFCVRAAPFLTPYT